MPVVISLPLPCYRVIITSLIQPSKVRPLMRDEIGFGQQGSIVRSLRSGADHLNGYDGADLNLIPTNVARHIGKDGGRSHHQRFSAWRVSVPIWPMSKIIISYSFTSRLCVLPIRDGKNLSFCQSIPVVRRQIYSFFDLDIGYRVLPCIWLRYLKRALLCS